MMIRSFHNDQGLFPLTIFYLNTELRDLSSVLEDEWDELALKRHWVKNAFDL